MAGLRRAHAPACAAHRQPRGRGGRHPRGPRGGARRRCGTVLLTGGPIALLLAALAGYGLATAALRPVGAMRGEAAEISRLGSGRRLPVPPAGDELVEARRDAQRDARAAGEVSRARARLRGQREPRAAHAAGAAQGGAGAGAARGPHAPRSCATPWRPRPARATGSCSSPRTCWCSRAPTRAGCRCAPSGSTPPSSS